MKNKKYIQNIVVMSIALIVIVIISHNVIAATDIVAPPNTGLPSSSNGISDVVQNIIKLLVGIIGGLSILMIVVGGIMYITSGGDSTKTETAKNIIIYSIVGLVISLLAWIIVNAVIGTIDGSSTSPSPAPSVYTGNAGYDDSYEQY